MKKLHFHKWATLTAACLLFFVFGITGRAARTGTVRINDVNVRSEASTDSNRVCKLPINTTVDVVDQKDDSDGKTWYSVSFTLDGADKAGWIRSDMLTVSEEEAPAEEPDVQEPDVQEPAYSEGWYYYNPETGSFEPDDGQHDSQEEPAGLIEALQKELGDLKESSQKQLSMRLYIIIGLGALSAILLILTIVFAVKGKGSYEYEDEGDDEDEYDEDEEDEEDDEEEAPRRKKGLFGRRKRDEEEESDEEDDFDDFFAAAKKKQSRITEDAFFEDDEEELDDDFEEVVEKRETADLPEIDMSAVLAVEHEAAESEAVEEEAEPEDASEDDDFEIEILDLDDLGL